MPSILKHVAADERRAFIWRSVVAAAVSACLISAPTLAADSVPQNDLLNAELWMQTAIEYRANCLTVYALAKVRLDEALADTNWTAYDQTGSYQNLPPAVIIDLDETAIDNSAYVVPEIGGTAYQMRNPRSPSPRRMSSVVAFMRATRGPRACKFPVRRRFSSICSSRRATPWSRGRMRFGQLAVSPHPAPTPADS
jgi:hypothetical protein